MTRSGQSARITATFSYATAGATPTPRRTGIIGRIPQQTLHTRRLTLLPLADEHLEWEVELDSDPEVMRYLTGRPSTRDEVEAQHARRLAATEKVDGLGYWVGLVDDEFVGWWILQPAHGPDQPDDPAVADLGYRLLPRHWHKGLASEGARELVRYGFEDVGLARIIAQTLTANAGSRAVMDRIGLTYVRTFPTSMTGPVEGLEEGEVEYELTREQWQREAREDRPR
jgi:RimJ/RimL family protein N-acetyltransferase